MDLDPTDTWVSYPRLPDVLIPRDNLLDAVERALEGDVEAIAVEAPNGTGKTIFTALFCKKVPNRCFAFFAKPTSSALYDGQTILNEISSQVARTIGQKSLAAGSADPPGHLNNVIYRLMRLNSGTFFIIIDGLESIPDTERQLVLGRLPFGIQRLKFIFTGDASLYQLKGVNVKPYLLARFSLNETQSFLSDIGLDQSRIETLHRLTKGHPASLAAVRRIASKSPLPPDLKGANLTELYDIEWQSIPSDDQFLNSILGLVALENVQSIDSMCALLCTQSDKIGAALADVRFVEINEDRVSFVSEDFCHFAQSKLVYLKQELQDLVIEHLRGGSDAASQLLLADRQLRARRFQDALSTLSTRNFLNFFHATTSYLSLSLKAVQVGSSAASAVASLNVAMLFGLRSSVVVGLRDAQVWRSEVRARVVLGETDKALALAQTTGSPEARLQLLAAVGRYITEEGKLVPPELNEQLQQLTRSAEVRLLGDSVLQTVEDTMFFDPELALELLVASSDANTGNGYDWALSKLAAERHTIVDTSTEAGQLDSEPMTPIQIQLKLISLQGLGGTDLLKVIERVHSAEAKLFLIRQWCKLNPLNCKAGKVIETGLTIMIQTTAISPNTSQMRELMTPLLVVSSSEELSKLVSLCDAQLATLKEIGPTLDYFRSQFILARAESRFSFDNCAARLIESALQVMDIEDLATRASCAAWLKRTLDDVDSQQALERKEQLHTLVSELLTTSVDKILEKGASQFNSLRDVLAALAEGNPGDALALAARLNIPSRRDAALLHISRKMMSCQPSHYRLLWSQATQHDYKDSILAAAAGIASRNPPDPSDWRHLISLLKEFRDPRNACKAVCELCDKLPATVEAETRDELISLMVKWWAQIETLWDKLEFGYLVVAVLAKDYKDKALEVMKGCENLRTKGVFDSGQCYNIFQLVCMLAIRSYSALVRAKLADESDFDLLLGKIVVIPSCHAKIKLLNTFAAACYLDGQYDKCKRVVSECIKPTLELTPKEQYDAALVEAAPALYFAHPRSANELLSSLPQFLRDRAYSEICSTTLHGCLPGDPIVENGCGNREPTLDELCDVVELCGNIEEDDLIYEVIETVVDQATSRQRSRELSRQQKADIARRLLTLIGSKFPAPNFIKHDGYAIIAKAQVARIVDSPPQDWVDLVSEANLLGNDADRAYVLTSIVNALPKKQKYRPVAQTALCDAREVVRGVSCAFDKSGRGRYLAEVYERFDKHEARQLLSEAFLCSQKYLPGGIDKKTIQRRIVDLMYRLNADLSPITSAFDDDPARADVERFVNERKQLMDIENRFLNIPQRDSIVSDREFGNTAWSLLAKLNGKRIMPPQKGELGNIIDAAARRDLSYSYPAFAFVMESLRRKYVGTPEAARLFRPCHEGAIQALDIVTAMAARSAGETHKARTQPDSSINTSLLVKFGARVDAVNYIREWLRNEVDTVLTICDPYFGAQDLVLVALVLDERPEITIRILTSSKHQSLQQYDLPVAEAFQQEWKSLSDQPPPFTEVTILGSVPSDNFPIHDRWWLSQKSGLRVGTSYNGLGKSKDSEISRFAPAEIQRNTARIEDYLFRREREVRGERLRFQTFSLG